MSRQSLQRLTNEILDLLSNGPSSFAALFRYVTQEPNCAQVTVEQLWDLCLGLGSDGTLSVSLLANGASTENLDTEGLAALRAEYGGWLGTAPTSLSIDDVAYDPVGIWFKLTPAGTDEWRARLTEADDQLWTMEEDLVSNVIEVRAVDAETAERLLNERLQRTPSIRFIEEGRRIQQLDGFVASSQAVEGGVLVSQPFELIGSDDPY